MKTYIGDAVIASPILPVLEREFSEIQILTAGVIDQVLWTPDRERKFLKLAPAKKVREVLAQARLLRAERFGIAMIVNHSFRSALIARLAGIPVRIGHIKEKREFLLTHRVPYSETEWETHANFNLLKPLGLAYEEALPVLPLRPEEVAEGKRAVDGATVGLQVGARFPEKQLPVGHSVEIAKALLGAGHRLVLLGGPDDQAAEAEFQSQIGGQAVSLVGKTDIRGTLGALANLRLMVGSDTGLMHLAAGVKVPTVTVFGPTPSVKWGHHYAPHTVIQAPGGVIANASPKEIIDAAFHVIS